jgi:hypothetical protein
VALIDKREIEFDTEALLIVVATSQRAAESFGLPGFPPNDVRFDPKQGTVGFLYGSAQSQRSIYLTAEVVGALLVSYCIRARIPMPRKASKGVRVEGMSVILAFRTVFSPVPTPAKETSKIGAAAPVKSLTWGEPVRALV